MIYSYDQIRQLMKWLHITQTKMAEMLGISRQTMSKLMNDEQEMKKKHFLAMTYVLDKYMDEQGIEHSLKDGVLRVKMTKIELFSF